MNHSMRNHTKTSAAVLSLSLMLGTVLLGCSTSTSTEAKPEERKAPKCESMTGHPELEAEAKTYTEFLASLGAPMPVDKATLPMTDVDVAKHMPLVTAAIKDQNYSPIKIDDKFELMPIPAVNEGEKPSYVLLEHFDGSHDREFYYNGQGQLESYREIEAFSPCTMGQSEAVDSCEYRTLFYHGPSFALDEQMIQRGPVEGSGYMFDAKGTFLRYDSDGTCYSK